MATILIVDDDAFTRSVLESIFVQGLAHGAAAGAATPRVLTAASGEEGLEAFRVHRPEVAVIDLLMPKMDGFALCGAIRAEPEGQGTHLVVVSGVYGDVATTRRARDEFGAAFFAKPYQLKDMTRHVRALLEGEPAEAPAGSPEVTVEVSSGELADRPVPAVLLDLLDARATGAVELARGRIRKRIQLHFGHPISVTSSAREETLGHFLVARGVIDDAQQRAAIKRAAEKGERVGEALIALGAITPEQLVEQLGAQVRHKIVQSLRWPDGSWRFVPEAVRPGAHGGAIDMAHLIVHGLRQTAAFDLTPPSVVELADRPLSLDARGHGLMPLVRNLVSRDFADRWRHGTTVGALAAAGVDRAELHVALDLLVQCDALVVGNEGELIAGDEEDFDLRELSEHSQMTRLPMPPPEGAEGDLYAALFDDTDVVTQPGRHPLDLADGVPRDVAPLDSGYIDVRGIVQAPGGERNTARRMLLEEYLRIQDLDHYQVLMLDRQADAAAISAAVVERRTKFSLDWFARFDLGRDYARLEEIHAAYDRAFRTLLDDRQRSEYDRQLAGGEAAQGAPSLEAELGFRTGEELLAAGNYTQAAARFEVAVREAPNEADYHAALGWARYLEGKRAAPAADRGRTHLNQALAINPDHARAHEYKGIIGAALGSDDVEAMTHLERALELDPGRSEALEALERLWAQRGELRPLGRQYRRMIYRVAGRDARQEGMLWRKLGRLYRELGDRDEARIAFQAALRLAPDDAEVQAALADLESGDSHRFYERSEMLRSHWRRDPAAAGPGIELMRAALQAAKPDAAFMAASALVARGHADGDAEQQYQRYRPRFVVRAQRPLDPALWELVRHPDDDPRLVELFDRLAPVVHQVAPLSLADLDIDESMEARWDELPEAFRRVSRYAEAMVGAAQPRVFVRPDFGHQIHVGATEEPVLLVGDDVLAAPERMELAFRIGRAVTYLRPGRALGASRPPRLLKQCVLAAVAAVTPGARVPDPAGELSALGELLGRLPEDARAQVQRLVQDLTRDTPALNLSRWARALGHSADRVGMLLCGDLAAAVRFAGDSTTAEAVDDLVDYAIGRAHLTLRGELGVSIDV